MDDFQGYDSLDQRRRQLYQAMRGGMSKQGSRRALPLFGGSGRRAGSLVDLPAAPLPALTFDPFMAQHTRGVPQLAGPSRITAPSPPISDLTGAPAPMGPMGGPAPSPYVAPSPTGGGPTAPSQPQAPTPDFYGMAQAQDAYNYDPNLDVFRGSRMMAAPRRMFGRP